MVAAGNFEELLSTEVEGLIGVKKLRSNKTGLTVVVAEVESPLCYGYFTLATEAHDNDGLPHTLEHLIFLGSESYPYKGVLDKLANRCFAQGTNAWTDTDHTAYTVDTAGKEGFLAILPVYLDHVLRPTITPSGFVTEVHHINGAGENAGVVYSEMQGRENSGPSRAYRKMAEMLYGDPADCGYAAETGGIMSNLRDLTHAKVKQYHEDFYRPDNLCVIVVGKVTPQEVLAALEPVEKLHPAPTSSKPERSRPWFTKNVPVVAPGAGQVAKSIFPSDDESIGACYFGWRGPEWSGPNPSLLLAIGVVHDYLTEGATSPLRAALVDCENPVCGDVGCYLLPYKATTQAVYASDVPVEHLSEVQKRLGLVLNDIIEKGVDLDRMKTIIKRLRRQRLASLESNPSDVLATPAIYEFLYSEHGTDLGHHLSQCSVYDELLEKPASYWITDIMARFFQMKDACCVLSIPSVAEGEAVRITEESRTETQKSCLGDVKLAELGELLEHANKENDADVPPGIVSKIPVPDPAKIPLISVASARMAPGREAQISDPSHYAGKLDDESAVPFFVQINSVPTSFVEMTAVLDTHMLKEQDRPFLNLYLDLVLESAIRREGKIIPYEQIVKELLQDTVSSHASIGFGGDPSSMSCGFFSQCVQVHLKFDGTMYVQALRWMKELLQDTVFTADRIKQSASRLSSAIPSLKRSGPQVISALSTESNFAISKGSNKAMSIPMRQGTFLKEVIAELEKNPDSVIEKISNLRETLTNFSNLRLQITLNATKMDDITGPIVETFNSRVGPDAPAQPPVVFSGEFATDRTPHALVCGLDAIESSFLVLSCQGITSYTDPDYPAIRVLFEVLTALEGPLWKGIRGLGLAYSYRLQCAPEDGLILFGLYRSSQLVDAFEAGKALLAGYVADSSSLLEEKALEAARAGCVYSTISKESTMADAAFQHFINCELRASGKDYTQWFLSAVGKVTVSDLDRVLSKYVKSLLDVSKTSLAVATPAAKLDDIVDHLVKEGRSVEKVASLDTFFASQ